MKPAPSQRRSGSILGLCFDGSRMDGIVIRRTNGSAEVSTTINASLSLNLLSHEAELVGQEIRQQLQTAGVRERRCVVALPQNWALTMQVDVPDLPEADLDSFFQMEAERGFSTGLDTIALGVSRFQLPGGEQRATVIGMPRSHLERLDEVLRAAKLEAVAFSLGMPALHQLASEPGEASISLLVSENSLSLEVGQAAGVAALRSLDNAVEGEGSSREISLSVLMRELRVTLAQLPPSLRAALRVLRLFGFAPLCEPLEKDLREPLQALGLTVELVTTLPTQRLGMGLSPAARANPATALASCYLAGKDVGPAFLPPRISAWQRFSTRYSSKTLTYAAIVLAFIALSGIGLFAYQEVQLGGLRKNWAKLAPRVEQLETLQQDIKQYRPWFDASVRHLTVLKRLTEVFPEDGTVTAKTLEIRDGNLVTCAGTTKDAPLFYKMLDQLRTNREVSEVTVDQLRGESSRQFTFSFHWGEKSQP